MTDILGVRVYHKYIQYTDETHTIK